MIAHVLMAMVSIHILRKLLPGWSTPLLLRSANSVQQVADFAILQMLYHCHPKLALYGLGAGLSEGAARLSQVHLQVLLYQHAQLYRLAQDFQKFPARLVPPISVSLA